MNYNHPWVQSGGLYGHPLLAMMLGASAAEEHAARMDPVTAASLEKIGGVRLVQKTEAVGRSYGLQAAGLFAEAVTRSTPMVTAYRALRLTMNIAEAKAAVRGAGTTAASAANAKEAQRKAELTQAVAMHVHAAEAQTITAAVDGRAEVPANVGARDVKGRGGYVYRQYADGTIILLKSPKSGAGQVLRPRSGDAWERITNEIGTFPVGFTKPLNAFAGIINGVRTLAEQLPDGKVRNTLLDVAKGGSAALLMAGPTALTAGAGGGSAGWGGAKLRVAAGASSAGPGAGGSAAGGLGRAAATIAIVASVGKRREAQAIEFAQKHNIPDAARLPGFVWRVKRLSSDKRIALGERLQAQVQRAQGRRRARLEARLRVLATVELGHRAIQRRGRGRR